MSTTPQNAAVPAISAEHLVRRFGKFTAVNDVSFRVEQGEIFGFLGPNGSGKTTVIKLLTGLLPLSGGSAQVVGLDVRTDSESIRERVGYMSQNFSLYDDLTVGENLRFYGRIYSLEPARLKRRIDEIIALNNLGPYFDRLAAQLSGGWKQRLALGCAMLHEPQLLFLDEPTAGIDPVARRQLWDLLFELSGHGITFFVTTHYMDEAERCTEVGFVREGRLLVKESPRRLKASFKSRLIELEVDPVMPALAALRNAPGVLDATLRSGHARIYAAEPEHLLTEWQRAWPFPELTLRNHAWVEPDMEDVFKAYSQGFTQLLDSTAA